MMGNTYKSKLEQKILVVEDDLWMQPLIINALKMEIPNSTIDWVESAEEANARTKLFDYFLIISDIYLKPNRKNGLDLWNQCRDECPEIPILLMSSIPIEEFSKKMGLYGPHYLIKPFELSGFRTVIKNLISHNGLSS